MLVVLEPLAQIECDKLCRDHPRGRDIFKAIEIDLSRDPTSRASQLVSGRYAQVYTPPILPKIEIGVSYLVGEKVLIKVFKWDYIK